MNIVKSLSDPQVVRCLQGGGVAVLRTDTIYGIVAQAGNEAAVQRVYALKDRDEQKSPIVLIGDVSEMFDTPSDAERVVLDKVWPGKTSVIISSLAAPLWICRSNNSVAYRLPADKNLRELLASTGSLIAPSANPEGHPPALSIDEAYDYFGEAVDVYVDGGYVYDDRPSQLLRIDSDGKLERLR